VRLERHRAECRKPLPGKAGGIGLVLSRLHASE
jgi:hypothetical protein